MKSIVQTLLVFLLCSTLQNAVYAQCTVTTVAMPNGGTTAYTCPQDGNPDVVNFTNSGAPGSAYAYAITNAANEILVIVTGTSFNVDPAPPGNCNVWGFSYTGSILAQPGQSVFSAQFSTGCWNISKNAILVVRQAPDGGTVATPQGATHVYACLDDGIPDFIGFSTTSTAGANYRYVVTDDQNNILGLPGTAFLDFAGAGVGVCRVWGLSYTGMLTAQVGMNVATAKLASNCFDLSDNYITVDRNSVNGGSIAMPNGNTYRKVCTQNGVADVVDFVKSGASATANYAYAITNGSHQILEITTASSFNFDVAPSGICFVWGFSYTGSITAQAGQSVFSTQFSTGCWDISSTAITVDRTAVNAGTVAMPNGSTTRYTCPGDGVPDVVNFTTTSTFSGTYRYIVTDDQNNILGLPPGNSVDVEGAGEGACRIWGVAFTGNFTAQLGMNAATAMLSDGCYGLSSNYITTNRFVPDGGTVTTTDSLTTTTVTVGDGIADLRSFLSHDASLSKFAFVVTDDQNNILGLPPGNTVNFEDAGPGICRVWGLAYTGNLLAQLGDNAAAIELSNDCFDLSDNYVTVIRVDNLTDPNPPTGAKLLNAGVHPNPVSTNATLLLDLGETPADASSTVLVYDLSGRLVLQRQFDTFEGKNYLDLDVSGLRGGMYRVSVRNGAAVRNLALVKE